MRVVFLPLSVGVLFTVVFISLSNFIVEGQQQQKCTANQDNTGVESLDPSLLWAPLESQDGLGLDLRDMEPEPMRAVVEGRASSVIVRGVMSPEACDAAIKRLSERELLLTEGGSCTAGAAAMQYPFRRLPGLTDVGVTIHGLDSADWQEAALRQNQLFSDLFADMPSDLPNPIERLHSVLNELARGSGKHVVPPEDMAGGVAGTTAIFRAHPPGPGSRFAPHFDGFQQGKFTPSGHADRPFRVMDPSYSSHAVLSAVMVLQSAQEDGEEEDALNPATDSQLFDISLDELALVESDDLLTAGSHWIGVHFGPTFQDFADRVRARRFSPRLRAGDMYLFSASRVHELFEVQGARCRVVVASFMSWSDALDEVLLFQ